MVKTFSYNDFPKNKRKLVKQLNKLTTHEIKIVRNIINDTIGENQPKKIIRIDYGFDIMYCCPNCMEAIKPIDNYCATCGIRFMKGTE